MLVLAVPEETINFGLRKFLAVGKLINKKKTLVKQGSFDLLQLWFYYFAPPPAGALPIPWSSCFSSSGLLLFVLGLLKVSLPKL